MTDDRGGRRRLSPHLLRESHQPDCRAAGAGDDYFFSSGGFRDQLFEVAFSIG
jgi:hypothetical protein